MADDENPWDNIPDDEPVIIQFMLTANPHDMGDYLAAYAKMLDSGLLNCESLKKDLFLVSAFLIDDSIKNPERAPSNLLKVAQIVHFGMQHPKIDQSIMSLSAGSFDDLVERFPFEDSLESFLLENNRGFYDGLYDLLDAKNYDERIREYLEPYGKTAKRNTNDFNNQEDKIQLSDLINRANPRRTFKKNLNSSGNTKNEEGNEEDDDLDSDDDPDEDPDYADYLKSEGNILADIPKQAHNEKPLTDDEFIEISESSKESTPKPEEITPDEFKIRLPLIIQYLQQVQKRVGDYELSQVFSNFINSLDSNDGAELYENRTNGFYSALDNIFEND